MNRFLFRPATRSTRKADIGQRGFITMIVLLMLIIAAVLFVAYKRVLDSQQ